MRKFFRDGWKFLAILPLLMLLLLFVGACDRSETETDGSAAQGEDLVIGVMPSMDYLPLAVARREGYFEHVGLRLKILKFYSANERDAALQSGGIDGTVIDLTGALLQGGAGVPLKITSRCDAPFYLVASKKSAIIDVADLKGARVAVSRNTVIDYCLDMALESAGLGADDVSKVEINKIPLRYEMLLKGEVDATGLPSPLAPMAALSGGRIITSNSRLGFALTGMVFSQPAVEHKGLYIHKLYIAYNMGVDYLREHGVEDVADILKEELGFSDEILPLAEISIYRRAEMPDPEDLRRAADWLIERGLLAADYEPESLLDDRFVMD